jgi:hypothetical protein
MLEGHPLQRIVEDLVHHPKRSSYTDLGALFDVLNNPTDHGRNGVLRGTRYVNGSMFSHAAKVHLDPRELAVLVEAHSSWGNIDPAIFGSLIEGCLGRDRRWELGAHYTHEVDIMRSSDRQSCSRGAAASMRPGRSPTCNGCLRSCVRLDPACGCGNFLYVAYRELRCLEHELKERLVRVAQQTGMQGPDRLGLPYYRLGPGWATCGVSTSSQPRC